MTDGTSTVKSVSSLMETIAKATSVIVSLSTIGYLVGYKIEINYLNEAGATWVLDLLSPAEFIREGHVVMLAIGVTFFHSILHLFENEGTAEKLRQKDIWLSAIAMLMLCAAYVTNNFFNNIKLDYVLSIFSGTLMAAAAGFTIGELVGRLNDSSQKWGQHHLYLLLFFYISAIVMAPYYIGTNQAKSDLDPNNSLLPIVSISGESTEKWRLIRTVGESYLLVSLSDKRSQRKFRMVPISPSVVVQSNNLD